MIVDDHVSGDYPNNNNSPFATLSAGEQKWGALQDIHDSDWFQVKLKAGKTYSFIINGDATIEETITLRTSGGTIVAGTDAFGATATDTFSYTTASDESYFLVTQDWGRNDVGEYWVRYTELDDTVTPPDQTSATSGNDVIIGTSGSDTVAALAGSDLVSGNAGADILYGNQGLDTVYGGSGHDTIYLGQNGGLATVNPAVPVSLPRSGIEYGYGEDGNDIIYGNVGSDVVSGGTGNDVLFGGQEDDTLAGGDGNDTMFGNLDDDLLFGGKGADVYVWHQSNGGQDTIGDFSTTEGDRIDINNNLSITVGTDTSGNVVIYSAISDASLTVIGSVGSATIYDVLI